LANIAKLNIKINNTGAKEAILKMAKEKPKELSPAVVEALPALFELLGVPLQERENVIEGNMEKGGKAWTIQRAVSLLIETEGRELSQKARDKILLNIKQASYP